MIPIHCRRCFDSGTILVFRSEQQPNGETLVVETTEPCPECDQGNDR